ncbi:MAG: TIGR03915 family putative DNA repair protein [Roseburia sp.]|nr:TIGR03915 family putative DNA repair protein [Roseburia sp.]
MDERYIYLCENSFEGILTAVYNAYEERHGHEKNKIQIAEGMYHQELFATYISVETEYEKAVKVARTIQNKVSPEVYEFIQRASASYNIEKADAIYRVIILALKMGRQVLNYLTEPNVQFLMELERNTANEIQHELQFLRFEELANGALFAKINPKNAVLPYLAEHFSDRFSGEDWLIADTVHGGVLVHEKNKGCSLVNAEDVDFDTLRLPYSEGEELWQKLWKRFVDSIAIKERVNPRLQMQMLPLRFRKYMKEMP